MACHDAKDGDPCKTPGDTCGWFGGCFFTQADCGADQVWFVRDIAEDTCCSGTGSCG